MASPPAYKAGVPLATKPLECTSTPANAFITVVYAFIIEIPRKVMRFGKARNSHDTIMYAINGWASWGFYNGWDAERQPQDIYINCKLRLNNCIACLFSGRIKKSLMNALNVELQDVLIEHAALFPPSESTYALHEIIHVASQIPKIGPPRFNCLFMFERVNLFLKRMVKNKHHHMGSIMKAYAKEEFITQSIGYNFTTLKNFITTVSCIPSDYNIVKKIINSFNNLHIEEDNVMYSLPNCRVHELRGIDSFCSLDDVMSHNLMTSLACIARDHSVLGQ